MGWGVVLGAVIYFVRLRFSLVELIQKGDIFVHVLHSGLEVSLYIFDQS